MRYKCFNKLEDLYTEDTTEQEFIEMWHAFLQTPAAQEELTNWSTELDKAAIVLECIETGTDVPADPLESDPEYSWYINNVKPKMMDEDILNVERDPAVWAQQNLQYNHDEFANLENILRLHSLQFYGKLDLDKMNENRRQIDLRTLSRKQRKAHRIIRKHFRQPKKMRKQLLALIRGTAGTGKSYLIDAIANMLGNKCVLAGTTGVAAFNIGGYTLDSILKLHIDHISDNTLKELQNNFKNVEYMIVDEMSMLGQKKIGSS